MEDKDKKLISNTLKKAGELFWDKPSEQALLAEYRSCQQDNSSSGTTYWAISGIFISINSAILGSLLYTIISNNELFRAVLGVSEVTNNSEMIEYLRVAVPIICIFMVVMLFLLR